MGRLGTVKKMSGEDVEAEDIRVNAGADADASEPAVPDEEQGDRRQVDRRETGSERAFTEITEPRAEEVWIPRRWPYLTGSILMCALANFALSKQWPGPAIVSMICFAVLGSLAVGRAHRLAKKSGMPLRVILAFVTVLLPLGLFSTATVLWLWLDVLPLEVPIIETVAVATISACYLRRIPGLLILAMFATFSWVLFSIGSAIAMALALATATLAWRVALEETRNQQEADRLREARDRVQSRARHILSDYEETGQGWFWETDRRSLLTYISPPVAKLLGRNPDRLIGQPLVQLFDLSDRSDENERTLMFHLSAHSSFQELPVRAACEGKPRWWSVSGRPIYDSDDKFVGFRGSGTDLTERKRSQDEAKRLARYDSLTGLANRLQMAQSLEKILTSPQVENRSCTVMLLDLDRFKQVNDTMGHPAGDALLRLVAQRLEKAVGKFGQVGRLGGDEFKVIIPGEVNQGRLVELARDIIHSLSQPYGIDGQRVVIGVSIGIACAPAHGERSDDLIRNADLALYAAKDGGRGRFHFFAANLHAAAEERVRLEEDLRDAIAKGDLQLFYQPVVTTSTERISGFEALLRWEHEELGWIPPQKFVERAEDSGLIEQIGEWVIRTACTTLAQWPEDTRLAVNVSPLQFSNPQMPAIVANAVARAGIDPSRLELEITESVFLTDDERTDATFAALKKIGVRMALDDFGTGYSSLGYLKKAPFDKIKIDQSFVRGATEEGSRNGAIIASITSLAHALGMDTTAEGVETLDELELVRLHGCSHVQGYIYDVPLPFEEATNRLRSGRIVHAKGPRAARAPRQKVLRKVTIDHNGQTYNGTIRNISPRGAMIEGLWNVPEGTVFEITMSDTEIATATARWSVENRMGVEFAEVQELRWLAAQTGMEGGRDAESPQVELRKAG